MQNQTQAQKSMNTHTDIVVQYMYKNEEKDFRENADLDTFKDAKIFTQKCKEHILYSVVSIMCRGDPVAINQWANDYWEEFGEIEEDAQAVDEDADDDDEDCYESSTEYARNKPCECGCGLLGGTCEEQTRKYAQAVEEEDEEEAPECFGKNCSNTNNLIVGKCWNRRTQSVTEELFCVECREQDTKIKCVACCNIFNYDQVTLKPEQFPWGSCPDGSYYNFFCGYCVKDITKGVEIGDPRYNEDTWEN